jgi:hypothetical protein
MGYWIRVAVIGIAFRVMVRRFPVFCLLFRATGHHVLGTAGIGRSARFCDICSGGLMLSRSPLHRYNPVLQRC